MRKFKKLALIWRSVKHIKLLAGIQALILLVGCASSGTQRQSLMPNPIPTRWTAQKYPLDPSVTHWVKLFADPNLASLIAEALGHNFDLQAAAARVRAAQAQSLISGAGRWPQMSFTPGYQEAKISDTSDAPSSHLAVFSALFSISWEIDLWGRIKASQIAAQQDARAVSADLQAAGLSLAARTAQSYFELLEAELQIKVAEQSAKERRVITDLVRGRFTRGLSRGLDLRLVLTDLANAEANLADTKNRRQIIIRQLEILLGRYPNGQVLGQEALPALPKQIGAGIPSELLERRPDLQAAYWRLQAVDNRVESAKKALLPRITLTAGGGTSSAALADLLEPRAAAWNLATGLVQPLFTGGRLQGEIRLNEARAVEALNQYRSAALTAFKEVEQALSAEAWLNQQALAVKTAVEQTQASRQLAVYSYRQGLIEILTLLDSYRSALNAQSAYLSVQRQLLNNRIDLYLALGGGV